MSQPARGSCLSPGSAFAFLMRLPTPILIVAAVIAGYAASIVVMELVMLVAPDAPLGGRHMTLHGLRFVAALIVACVIMPPFETFVFQWAIIVFLRRKLRWRAVWAVALSAAAFGLAHTYSPQYMLRAAAGGLVLGTVFVVEQEKRGSPFWVVTAVHSFYNLIAVFALSQLV
ncbi:CPBP family intramembrane glutamic endopeptidase [Caballeronia ptereochthonis]|uniref:Abortive infection protein n=1 Tax=Caballeronia ptereochthonis TaxID=1777144 RepID=A0A158D5Y1_9BURK|nr:CPBP family intramembrane glutamic endopeptidase [Caballeronia ptereochthonis]SAK89883.1 abortive infection protein [Caballeronia ptereochthonis]